MQIPTFLVVHPELGECLADDTQMEQLAENGWKRKDTELVPDKGDEK